MRDAPEVEGQSAPGFDQHAATNEGPKWIDAAPVAPLTGEVRAGKSKRAASKFGREPRAINQAQPLPQSATNSQRIEEAVSS